MTGAFLTYFRESIEQLKKVSWPSRSQTVKLTAMVVAVSVAAAAYLGFLDYALFRTVSLIIKR